MERNKVGKGVITTTECEAEMFGFDRKVRAGLMRKDMKMVRKQ